MTATRWQQFLLFITWIWPLMTIAHYDKASPGDIAGAVFWDGVWVFCLVRLKAKQIWPFS